MWEEKWRKIFPSPGIYFTAWILDPFEWLSVELDFRCLLSTCLRKTFIPAAKGGGREGFLIQRNPMDPTAVAFPALDSCSCFLFQSQWAKQTPLFSITCFTNQCLKCNFEALLSTQASCAGFTVAACQEPEGFTCARVRQGEEHNHSSSSVGHSPTLLLSTGYWTPSATGNHRAVGSGCIKQQDTGALN